MGSDDPRRGEKICLEKMRNINTSGIGNVHEKNSTLGMRILDDTSHTPTGKPPSNKDAGSSIIRTLSKKSHDLISSFISGFFTDREPEQSATTISEEVKNGKMKGNWDKETKISSMDENANEIHTSIGNHKGNINKVSDDLIENIDTIESEKANDMANNMEIDHTERIEPADEEKIRQFAITEKLDNREGCVFKNQWQNRLMHISFK